MTKPTQEQLLKALVAIRRWCDIMDHHTSSDDKVRSIRLVADDYLSRAGMKYDNRTYNARRSLRDTQEEDHATTHAG